jgi:hypothetical protein
MKETNSLTTNILNCVPGIFGLLLVGTFIELSALNFMTFSVNHQAGIAVLNSFFRKTKIQINDVSHILVKKERIRGISNSNGFLKDPDLISFSIHLLMKSGLSIKIISLRGVPTEKQNDISQMNNLAKGSAKEISNLLSVKFLTE